MQISSLNRFVTIANDLATDLGVRVDMLVGGRYVVRGISGAELLALSEAAGLTVLSPNGFNSFQVQDAGISITHPFGFVDISGGGSPGLTLNTAAIAAVSAPNSALLRRHLDGTVVERDFVAPDVVTVGAVTSSLIEFTTAAGFVYQVEASVVIANDTADEGGSFFDARLTAKNLPGPGLTLIGAAAIAPVSQLDASVATATMVLNIAPPLIRVRVTGVAGQTIRWRLSNFVLRPVTVV